MATSGVLKSWITRPEIEYMFFISTPTFNAWRTQGKWGEPVGDVPNESGRGRHMLAYSMQYVLEVYERELPFIAARAIAKGVSSSAFVNALDSIGYTEVEPEEVIGTRVVWMAIMDGVAKLMTVPEYTDDSPYYDGLPI